MIPSISPTIETSIQILEGQSFTTDNIVSGHRGVYSVRAASKAF